MAGQDRDEGPSDRRTVGPARFRHLQMEVYERERDLGVENGGPGRGGQVGLAYRHRLKPNGQTGSRASFGAEGVPCSAPKKDTSCIAKRPETDQAIVHRKRVLCSFNNERALIGLFHKHHFPDHFPHRRALPYLAPLPTRRRAPIPLGGAYL